MANKTIRVRVHGRVQGVFFRHHTKLMAESLGLTGWVRNCFDGTVEVLCTGGPAAISRMEEWLHQGPEAAVVDHLSIEEIEPPDFSEGQFNIKY